MRFNPYNTTDSAKLLELKREESLLLLELLRNIKPGVNRQTIIRQTVDIIVAQLSVFRLMLVTRSIEKNNLTVEVNLNFPYTTPTSLSQIIAIEKTTRITPEVHPLLSAMNAEFIIPVGPRQQPSGWFIIADFAESPIEEENDLIFIETAGNIMMIALEHTWLFNQEVLKDRIKQELEVASRIQKQSLPANWHLFNKVDLHAVHIAHHKVAGDFYDILQLDKQTLYFCIADVAGKGIAAALLVANLQASMRAFVRAGADFEAIVHHLHTAVEEIAQSDQYVTLFLAKLNLTTGQLSYVNAGHPAPLLISHCQTKELTVGAVPLGIMPLPFVEVGHEQLRRNDLLLLYTDGVIEQRNSAKIMLGLPAVKSIGSALYGFGSEMVGEKVLQLVWSHAEDAPADDDLTLVVVRFTG